ncbi:hypothetical protein SUGI_0390870 [Cryptomeria japonica]|nr:hypothetical protein SUGI_0390870 [Cryptomeria japonica]
MNVKKFSLVQTPEVGNFRASYPVRNRSLALLLELWIPEDDGDIEDIATGPAHSDCGMECPVVASAFAAREMRRTKATEEEAAE